MNDTLSKIEYDFIKETLPLPLKLEELISSGFRIEKDCILLKEQKYFGDDIDSDFKKTEYEEFLNHIHIDDYITCEIDDFEYLKVGLELGKRIYKSLNESSRTSFRITISFSEAIYENHEIDVYGSCVVHFYMIREECDKQFRIENLDSYELERVLVLESNNY